MGCCINKNEIGVNNYNKLFRDIIVIFIENVQQKK